MGVVDPTLEAAQKQILEMHVLIVDDEKFDRDLLQMTLEKIGLTRIECAESGGAAVQRLESMHRAQMRFDMIFLDWKMPVRDGHSLLKVIRRQFMLFETGVFITTSSSSPEAVKAFIAGGADDFIVKPVGLDVVRAKLERFALKQIRRVA